MKNTNQLIGCCGLDCEQMEGCPTLGRIVANSPFALGNLKRLKPSNAENGKDR